MPTDNIHKIIHVDMDAFFASVEQRDNPELRGKPVIVGGSRLRGVVAAASYEARKFGVHSAMPTKIAYQKCPTGIFVKGHFDKYIEASKQIMKIFKEFTNLVEPVSLDEAYLDVTVNYKGIPSATWIAQQIRNKIKNEINLTASAGVSFNKFLAKVASDYKKPDGLFVITPDMADDFIDKLPIGKIPGIGKVTKLKMEDLGIFTGKDLKDREKSFLIEKFGKYGGYFFDLLRHNYFSQVRPERERKSIGAERTFEKDIINEAQLFEALKNIADKLHSRMINKQIAGKTITLKIKYFDFEEHTRSRTLRHLTDSKAEILDIASELLFVPLKPIKAIRLLGIHISNLNSALEADIPRQLVIDFYGDTNIQVHSDNISPTEKPDSFGITDPNVQIF